MIFPNFCIGLRGFFLPNRLREIFFLFCLVESDINLSSINGLDGMEYDRVKVQLQL